MSRTAHVTKGTCALCHAPLAPLVNSPRTGMCGYDGPVIHIPAQKAGSRQPTGKGNGSGKGSRGGVLRA
jgi:hypothetical protein